MTEKRKVTVVLLPGEEGGYAVFIPLFPGCTTGGDTVQEALKNAKECLELALEKPTADDLEFLGYLDVEHVVLGRIEVEVPAQVPAPRSFEEVWELLKQLEGKTITTLVHPSRNLILAFEKSKMKRKNSIPVPRSAFERIWKCLSTDGVCVVQEVDGWGIAAACLVHVPELGIERIPGKGPLTLKRNRTSTS